MTDGDRRPARARSAVLRGSAAVVTLADVTPPPTHRPRTAVSILAWLVLLVACSSRSDEASDDDAGEPRPTRVEQRPSVRIAVTDWTGARLNVAIAEQLIERRLGYPVSAVDTTDTTDMLIALESG